MVGFNQNRIEVVLVAMKPIEEKGLLAQARKTEKQKFLGLMIVEYHLQRRGYATRWLWC